MIQSYAYPNSKNLNHPFILQQLSMHSHTCTNAQIHTYQLFGQKTHPKDTQMFHSSVGIANSKARDTSLRRLSASFYNWPTFTQVGGFLTDLKQGDALEWKWVKSSSLRKLKAQKTSPWVIAWTDSTDCSVGQNLQSVWISLWSWHKFNTEYATVSQLVL